MGTYNMYHRKCTSNSGQFLFLQEKCYTCEYSTQVFYAEADLICSGLIKGIIYLLRGGTYNCITVYNTRIFICNMHAQQYHKLLWTDIILYTCTQGK